MYLLKLFHETDLVQPVDAHMLGEGLTRIGRDPGVDWVISDPECQVSRTHLEICVENGEVMLTPVGANGVFRTDDEERLPNGEKVPASLGDSFSFGKFRLVVDRVPFADRAGQGAAHTMVMAPPFGFSTAVPTDWADGSPGAAAAGEGSLLEAFCEGAKLDASAFSGEDPMDVMRRAGAVYRQMVLGVGDLMSERSSIKTQYRMDRTTISAEDNNPFKWAPTQRLAIDLLLRREAGFLSGAAALKASFEDIKKHLLCTFAGFRASLLALLNQSSPTTIESRVEGQNLFLKSRAAACWAEYEQIHAALETQMEADQDGPINQAFIRAYEEKMRDLDRGGTEH
jgi:predicted component of type VI protein secretion system